MEEKNKGKLDEIEIDVGRVFQAILDKAWLVTVVAVLCAVLTFAGTFFFVTPQYQSSAMFYVNNSNLSLGDTSLSISSGDLVTSRGLVDSYIVILNTRETLVDVLDYSGAPYSAGQLRGMISASAVNETEIFKVTVTSPDPEEAERLASAIAYILPKRIATIIDGTSARVADAAIIPSSPSSPSYVNNTMIGFLLGLVAACAVIAVRVITDTTIRAEGDVGQSCHYPILAAVPDMTAPSKGSAYYGSSRKKKGKYAATAQQSKQGLIGPAVSFAASEAYKLLRTKLQFSFADDHDSHIIGLSSALSGEGKSLTAVNLAYTLSQLDKKVLLIDCDMRRPTLAEKLNIKKHPGLSNYLTRQNNLEELLQVCELKAGENAFHVISAGQNPPNPVELLSSSRMKKALDHLRQVYDYVILDLPPVGEVSDAMTVSQYTDGILLVVRQNYCDRNVLSDTVQQFDFVNAKTLGVVFNCTSDGSGKGYYKKYYKRYYNRYGKSYAKSYARSYGRSYEDNDRKVVTPDPTKK